LNDPKVQRLKAEHFKGWINLLCLAKEQDGILPQLPDIAFSLRISKTEAQELVSTLQRNGLLDKSGERFTPHN
jgi:DNA-binding IclR family transcriptional regulator